MNSTKSTFSLKAADFIQPPAPTTIFQKRNGKKAAKAEDAYLIVGFDTEFKGPDEAVTREEIKDGEATYRVLSYQFHCRLESGEHWSGVGCPDHDERISLGEFLVFALGSGIESGVVTTLPTTIYLVGHFTRADVPAFSDFKDIQSILTAVRNTFVSINQCIHLNIECERDSPIELQVHLRDTMLLSPGSTKSLAALGDLVGRPKIVLGPEKLGDRYFKKNMDVLRRDNWPLFREYALNDAVICVEYVQRLMKQTEQATGSRKIPVTLTSIGVDLLLKSWKDKLNIDRLSVLGLEKSTTDKWDQRLGHYRKVFEEVPLEECAWHLDFVTETYHGGRNEQFWFGPAYEVDWTDYDLSSAYPTAMSLIGTCRIGRSCTTPQSQMTTMLQRLGSLAWTSSFLRP